MALYKAKPGAGFNHKTAQVIGEQLEMLGEFGPQDMVRVAESPASPLHALFTWDNDEAGEKWRLHEARQIVNHLTMVVKIDGVKQETKAFYSVPVRIEETGNVEPRYIRVTHAIHDKAIRRTILDELLADLIVFKEKYEQFKSIISSDLFDVMEATVRKFEDENLRKSALKRIYSKVQPTLTV